MAGLDMSSLPSLDRFDSQVLERLLRATTQDGQLAMPMLDEQVAPDPEAALQRLMAGSNEAQAQVRHSAASTRAPGGPGGLRRLGARSAGASPPAVVSLSPNLARPAPPRSPPPWGPTPLLPLPHSR